MSEDTVVALLDLYGIENSDRAAIIARNVAEVTGHGPLIAAKSLARFLLDPTKPVPLERLVGPLPPWTEPTDVLDYLMVSFYVGAER